MFIHSHIFTTLKHDEIIIRFGGDKGGQFMKFKFGYTLMNSSLPNSPDDFQIVGTLDADNAYYNLYHGLFNNLRSSLDMFFIQKKSLSVLVFKMSEGGPVINIEYCNKSVSTLAFSNLKVFELDTEETE